MVVQAASIRISEAAVASLAQAVHPALPVWAVDLAGAGPAAEAVEVAVVAAALEAVADVVGAAADVDNAADLTARGNLGTVHAGSRGFTAVHISRSATQQ
jgi:hypothetical protein